MRAPRKFQIPNPKIQTRSKSQIPNEAIRDAERSGGGWHLAPIWNLDIGISLDFGIWILEFRRRSSRSALAQHHLHPCRRSRLWRHRRVRSEKNSYAKSRSHGRGRNALYAALRRQRRVRAVALRVAYW